MRQQNWFCTLDGFAGILAFDSFTFTLGKWSKHSESQDFNADQRESPHRDEGLTSHLFENTTSHTLINCPKHL